MEFFAIFFAVFMIAAALAATVLIGVFAGGIWGALAFAAVLILLYRAMTHQSGPDRSASHREEVNAFQRPLSDD